MTRGSPDITSAYVGIGSNLNDPSRQIRSALELLDAIPGSRLVSRSSLYQSAPFGPVEQPDFVNAVAQLHTSLGARALLEHLQGIERLRGREPGVRWGPRILDLDLLVFGDQQITEPNLTVPHAGIGQRNFVLLPLREIAPQLLIPGLGCVSDIAVNEFEPQISRVEQWEAAGVR